MHSRRGYSALRPLTRGWLTVMLLVTAAAQVVLLGFCKRPRRVRPPGGARGAGVPHRAGMAVSRASVPAHDLHRDTVVRPLPGAQARQGCGRPANRAPGGSILDQLLRFPLIAAVGLLGAEVLRHLVEQPMIRLGRRLTSRRSGRRTPELEPAVDRPEHPVATTTEAQRMTATAEPGPEAIPAESTHATLAQIHEPTRPDDAPSAQDRAGHISASVPGA